MVEFSRSLMAITTFVTFQINEKINIMEVCPKWTLELLREKKRNLMRATLIDNQTYRRAMEVSEYVK